MNTVNVLEVHYFAYIEAQVRANNSFFSFLFLFPFFLCTFTFNPTAAGSSMYSNRLSGVTTGSKA